MEHASEDQAPTDVMEPDAGDLDSSAPDLTLRTGHAPVDEVLDSLSGLDDLPVADHVAVFEQAHQTLRSALDARSDA